MKIKFTFSIVFSILFCALLAQTPYIKMLKEDTTTWQHFGPEYVVKSSVISTTTSPNVDMNAIVAIDTITLNNKLYKKLYTIGSLGSGPATLDYSNKILTGFLREDTVTKKVYYKNHSAPEILLYDFNLNVNDSILLNFPTNNSFTGTGYYKVDSIKTKTELGGQRKHFYLRKIINNHSIPDFYFDIIEGIGSTYHFFYLYISSFTSYAPFNSSPACYHPWVNGLTCKHNDNAKEFQSCTFSYYNQLPSFGTFNVDSCSYYYTSVGLKYNDLEQSVKIGPSPADDILQIQIESSYQQKSIILYDMSGREIFNSNSPEVKLTSNSIDVRTSNLTNGIYLLQVNVKDKKISRPIVIQH
jgi:hypothetical protein